MLRTRQLPDYMRYTRLHQVPALVKDIKEQADKVYSLLYRTDVDVNKFIVADIASGVLNGKIGRIVSYDEGNQYCSAYVPQGLRWNLNSSQVMPVQVETMERLKMVHLCAYNSVVSAQDYEVVIENLFACRNESATTTITFRDDAYYDLRQVFRHPDSVGEQAYDHLTHLLDSRELIEREV